MNLKEVFHKTAYSVQLPYIKGCQDSQGHKSLDQIPKASETGKVSDKTKY